MAKCKTPGCSNRADGTWGLLCGACGGAREIKDGFKDVGRASADVGKAVGATAAGLVASFGGGIGGIVTMALTVWIALNLDAVIATLVAAFWAVVGLVIAMKAIKTFGLVTTIKYGAMAGAGIFLLLCLYFFVIYPNFINAPDSLPAIALVEAGDDTGPVPTELQGKWLGSIAKSDGWAHGGPNNLKVELLGRNISWTNQYDQTRAFTDIEGVQQNGVFAFKAKYEDDDCAGELEMLSPAKQAITISCLDYSNELEWRFMILEKGGDK